MLLTDLQDEKVYYIAFDPLLFRPGCALVQAALGGEGRYAQLFDEERWALSVTSDMKLTGLTGAEWKEVADMVKDDANQAKNQRNAEG